MGPDTLNPNGTSIIQNEGSSRPLIPHVEPGGLRPPCAINQLRCAAQGGAAPLRGPSPLEPPLTSATRGGAEWVDVWGLMLYIGA